jgi:two-component system phosphate regulon response regulator PhoB
VEGLTINHTDSIAESSPASLPGCERPPAIGRQGHRIVVVERDAESMQNLSGTLAMSGFAVTACNVGEDALATIDRERPHLVIVDWDLPGVITMDLLRHVRRHAGSKPPRLIALSTFAGEQQVVAGLELGLDDYVVKPFSAREVISRIRAVLRPFEVELHVSEYVEFKRLRMDASEGRVTVRDRTVSLRGMEFRLLEFLMRHPERAFQREHLLQRVWGHDCRADPRAVDVTIQRIRQALTPHACQHYLQTVRGVGYRISATAE